MAGARGGSSGEMFFLNVVRLVTIVLRDCGGRLVGAKGLLGRGLAFVRAMALRKLANSDARRKWDMFAAVAVVVIAGELVVYLYV